MAKKKVKRGISKTKVSKKKKVTRRSFSSALAGKPEHSKFRGVAILLLIIIGLGYWWFTSGKKVETPTIPGSKVQQTESTQVSPSPEITWETYTVRPGDNLRGIALQVYGDANAWERIAKANNLKNPDRVHAGNVLRIPR